MQKLKTQTTGMEVAGFATLFKKSFLAVVLLTAGLQCSEAAGVQSPKGAEQYGSAAMIAVPSKKVRIGWSFPVAFETSDLVFKVYHSTDLRVPVNQWPLWTNIPGSNRFAEVSADQVQEFFVVTASNYLGESGFATQ